MNTVFLIIIGVLLFTFIVFMHELGHFASAKLSGVRVNEFAIGMGPKIIKIQKGETLYSLRLIPIGGFCSMEGEDGESADLKAFARAKVWKRIIIISMGAIMNLIVGFLIVMIIQGQAPMFASTTVSRFAENVTSQQSGLQVGDKILKIDGYTLTVAKDSDFALTIATKENVDVVVLRDGKEMTLKDVQFPREGNSLIRDFYFVPIPKTVGTLITQSFKETVSMVKLVWVSLYGMITGRFGLQDMAGPVGAASMIGQAAGAGLERSFADALNNLLAMMALISVNLGIVNLLPLPALDGGRLVFLFWEGIFRKPLSRKYEGYVHGAGFVLLMLLMVVLTFNDIARLITGG